MSVIDWINKRLKGLKIDPLDLMAEYEEGASLVDGYHLLPALLERNHPLKILAKVGALVVSSHNREVDLVLDTGVAKLDCPGVRRLLIAGELSKLNELSIAGISAEDEFSLFMMLANAAALLRKNLVKEDKRLTVVERTAVRQCIKDWKSIARETGLPMIDLIEDPRQRPAGSNVLYPLIGKSVVLNFVDKKQKLFVPCSA